MFFNEFIDEVRHMDGRSASRPISAMAEVYKESDAFFIVGQHPMRGTHRGVIEHTFLPPLNELKVNGKSMGEMGMKAAVAGYYDVPVAFVSGCDQAVAEARDIFGDVEAVAVKKGMGRQSAILLPSSARITESRSNLGSSMDASKPGTGQNPSGHLRGSMMGSMGMSLNLGCLPVQDLHEDLGCYRPLNA